MSAIALTALLVFDFVVVDVIATVVLTDVEQIAGCGDCEVVRDCLAVETGSRVAVTDTVVAVVAVSADVDTVDCESVFGTCRDVELVVVTTKELNNGALNSDEVSLRLAAVLTLLDGTTDTDGVTAAADDEPIDALTGALGVLVLCCCFLFLKRSTKLSSLPPRLGVTAVAIFALDVATLTLHVVDVVVAGILFDDVTVIVAVVVTDASDTGAITAAVVATDDVVSLGAAAPDEVVTDTASDDDIVTFGTGVEFCRFGATCVFESS